VKNYIKIHRILIFVLLLTLQGCRSIDHGPLRIQPEDEFVLGSGWASNTINTVIFRSHGLISGGGSQFGAFYDDQGHLVVFERELGTEEITEAKLESTVDLTDAHNSISMGIDQDGYLHLSYGHHNSQLRYRRSLNPLSIASWTNEIQMTGANEDSVTYPTFISIPNISTQDEFLFLYRDGQSGGGAACLKIFLPEQQMWQDIDPCILDGSGHEPWSSSPYWNHPAVDGNGRLHLSFTWRTHSISEDNLVNNLDVDYAMSQDSGRSWETSKGIKLLTPITQVNSETILAIGPGSNLINQTSSAVDSNNYLHVVYYADDLFGIPQYQHLWFDGTRWKNDILSERTHDFELAGGGTLQIPISRPDILIDSSDVVYVIYRGDLTDQRMAAQRLLPPNYEPRDDVRILWPEELGYAEPIIDRTRWQAENILSMIIQKNYQPPHDEVQTSPPEPVYLVDWHLIDNW
jgi:hypothetical protein